MSKDRLEEVIHHLIPSEKRYFKQYIQRYSAGNDQSNYAKLFNYISEHPGCSTGDILRSCTFVKASQIQNTKSRLYHYILDSLRAYHAGRSPMISFHQDVINYQILFQKGLYQQCWKMLQKLEKQANLFDSPNYHDEVLKRQEYLLTVRLKSKKSPQMLEEIAQQRESNKQLFQLIAELNEWYNQIYSVFKSEGRMVRDEEAMREVMMPLDYYEERVQLHPNSFLAAYKFHYNASLAYRELYQLDQAKKHVEACFQLFEKNKVLIELHHQLYQKCLNLSVILYNLMGDYELSKQRIKLIRQGYSRSHDEDVMIQAFENAEFQRLEIFLHEHKFHEAIEHISSFVDRVFAYEENMHNVNLHSKFYRIALAYFGAGDYRNSLKWVNRIINSDKLKFRKDIISSVHLLNLLVHYELGNYDLLESRLSSSRLFLKKIDRWMAPEQALFSALKKLCFYPKKKDEILKQFISDVQLIEADNYLDAFAMAYYDLKYWAKESIR